MQGVNANDLTGSILNQVGSLTIDLNRQIPVRVHVGDQSGVSGRGGTEDRTGDRCGHIRGTTGQDNLVIDVRSICSCLSKQNIVQRVLTADGQVVRGGDNIHLSTTNVNVGGSASDANDIEVRVHGHVCHCNLLNREGYRPELVGIQLKHTVNSCRNSLNGVLSRVQNTFVLTNTHAIGRLVDGILAGNARQQCLVAKTVVALVVTNPLIDGVVNEVLQTLKEACSGLVGHKILILVNISNKERAGISESQPLVVVVLTVCSSSSAHEGTTSSVELSVGSRSDQVTLILLTVESSSDALGVVLGDTLQISLAANNVINIVGVLHEHKVAANREHLSYHRHIAVKGCSGDGDKTGFGVAGGIQVVSHSGVTDVHRAVNGRVGLNGFCHGSGNSCGNLTVVCLVVGNVIHRNGYRNTQPLAIGGVSRGSITSNQFDAIDNHLHEDHVSCEQSRRKVGGIELRARGEELQLNDLVRGAYANNAKVAYLGILEELVYAVVAQERNAAVRNSRISNANQLFVVVEGSDRDRNVKGEPCYGYVLLCLHEHVDGAEISEGCIGSTTGLLVNVNAGCSRSNSRGPEGKSCHVIALCALFFN